MKLDRFLKRYFHRQRQGMVILSGGLAFLGEAKADVVFSEDFEGLTMVDSTLASDGVDETDYSRDLPFGWTRDNTTTPAGGDEEYFGWTIVDPAFWINQAGEQLGRSMFTNASGNIALADPDQYDDGDWGTVEPNLFNSFLETPVIDLSNFLDGTLNIAFDSSFAPYDAQLGTVDLSFDGGNTFANLLTIDSLIEGNSNVARINEALSFASATDFQETGDELVLRFGLTNAGNEWWWALDNIMVTGDPSNRTPDQIIELTYQEVEGNVQVTATWNSKPGESYGARWTADVTNGPWLELDDSISSDGDLTTRTFTLGSLPIPRAFIQIIEPGG